MRRAIAPQRAVLRPSSLKGRLRYAAWCGLGARDDRHFLRTFPIILVNHDQGAERLWWSQHRVTRRQLEALDYTPEQLAYEVEGHLRRSAHRPDDYQVSRDEAGRPMLALMECCRDRLWEVRRDGDERRWGVPLTNPGRAVLRLRDVSPRLRAAWKGRQARPYLSVVLAHRPKFQAPSCGFWTRKRMSLLKRLERMVGKAVAWVKRQARKVVAHA